VKDLLQAQHELARAAGAKPKRTFDPPKNDAALRAKVKQLTSEKVKEAYSRHEKHDRYGRLSEIKKEMLGSLKAEAGGDPAELAPTAGPPPERPRRPRRAGTSTGAPRRRQVSLRHPDRLRHHGVRRLLVDGLGLRRLPLPHGRRRAHQGPGGRNRPGAHQGGG